MKTLAVKLVSGVVAIQALMLIGMVVMHHLDQAPLYALLLLIGLVSLAILRGNAKETTK